MLSCFTAKGHNPDVWEFLRSQDVPVIVNHSFTQMPGCLTVGYDAYAEFARLTTHLLDLGHTRFGMMMLTSPQLQAVGDRQPFERIRTKYQSIVDTLAAAGLSIPDEHITNTYFSLGAGRRCFRSIMAGPQRPTAIIGMNDQMAIGALIEAKRMGFDVPGDVSIVGCDDIELAAIVEPPLTTIRPPDDAMGTTTAECVLECIRDGVPASGWRELPAEFIVRGSTAPPPA